MQRSCPSGSSGRRGFTMIEMLTVIAIIAILAGILFPVFATVRKNVHRSTCMANMHQIGVAVRVYKDEHNGVYPEALFGFDVPGVISAGVGPDGQQLPGVPGLYPQYVKEKQLLRCPISPYQIGDRTPLQGQVPNPQFYGKYATRIYPAWDSYDGQVEPNKVGNPYIVKYTRHWSNQIPGYADIARQLLYKNPPDDTVVTWCTYHRDYAAGSAEPQTGSLDLVLYLDGHAKPVPSNKMTPLLSNGLTGSAQQDHSYLVGRGD